MTETNSVLPEFDFEILISDAAMNPDICINDSEKKIYTYPFKYNGQQIILRCFLNYVIVQLNNGKNLKVPGVFNATFEEYSNGIGEFRESNYMIPLDVLHYLTAKHGFSILQVRIGIYGGDKIRAREINFVDFEIGSKVRKKHFFFFFKKEICNFFQK